MMKFLQRLIASLYYRLKLNYLFSWIDRFFRRPLKIMDAKETIDYIVENRCSVCRFGDGEFQMLTYGWDTGFQRSTPGLRKGLKCALQSTDENMLVCLSNRLNKRSKKEFQKIPDSWKKLIQYGLHDWLKSIPPKKLYGDANISRLTDSDIFPTKVEQVRYTKKIWQDRDVILVEGCGTCFGVGNDLLDNVASCRRIIAPGKQAYDKYDAIVSAACSEAKHFDCPLVLLALGPTATVMANDLCLAGIQAVDIGHLDLCYEMDLKCIKQGEAVPGRYTNEAEGGDKYELSSDSVYLSQIACRIGENAV